MLDQFRHTLLGVNELIQNRAYTVYIKDITFAIPYNCMSPNYVHCSKV